MGILEISKSSLITGHRVQKSKFSFEEKAPEHFSGEVCLWFFMIHFTMFNYQALRAHCSHSLREPSYCSCRHQTMTLSTWCRFYWYAECKNCEVNETSSQISKVYLGGHARSP